MELEEFMPCNGPTPEPPGDGSSPRRLWAAVALAQFLSLCLAITGISSATLAAAGVELPTSQSVLNYALLAATFGGARLLSGRGRGGAGSGDDGNGGGGGGGSRALLRRPWWCYALLAFVDVEANFLVVKAYQYTSLTSVTLLDCFTIPAVIALSYFVLGSRYRARHYAAASVCVAGLALLVASEGRSSTAGRAPLLGDFMVVLGACLYSVSNVTQELFLGGTPTAEVLGMLGAFGAAIAAAQAFAFERGAWEDLLWPQPAGGAAAALSGAAAAVAPPSLATVGAAFAAFTVALFAFSALVPVVLIWGGATALNLSLLTSDLWAAAARVALFGGFGGAVGWFAASLALVAAGLCLYASAGGVEDAAAGAAGQGRKPAAESRGAAAGGSARRGPRRERPGPWPARGGDSEPVPPSPCAGGAADHGRWARLASPPPPLYHRGVPQAPPGFQAAGGAREAGGGGADGVGDSVLWLERASRALAAAAAGGGWRGLIAPSGARGAAALDASEMDGAAAPEERQRLMRASLDGVDEESGRIGEAS